MLLQFMARRVMILVPLLLIISVISFVLIQLPPGDYLTLHIMNLKASGYYVDEAVELQLRRQYGLDKTLPVCFVSYKSTNGN